MILSLFLLVLIGCTTNVVNDNQSRLNEELPEDGGEKEKINPLIDLTNIPFTIGILPVGYQTNQSGNYPIVSHYEDYEAFTAAGLSSAIYNEAYFETKNLVILEEFDHIVGSSAHIERLSMVDGILSVLAIKRRPSMHICLYAPRSYVFAIEYAKPEGLIDVVGTTKIEYDVTVYTIPDELASLQEKLHETYINVEVSLYFNIEFEDTRERDQIMQEKFATWVVENDNCDGRISSSYIFITYTSLSMEELDRLMSIFEDATLDSFSVYVRNF
jgi:hypothetical protein